MTKFTKIVLICWIVALISLGGVSYLTQKEIDRQVEAGASNR